MSRTRTPKKAYLDQKCQAEARDIEWALTYEEWLEMWLVSGHYNNRGKGRGNYQLCRFYDEGAYSTTNCYIGTVEENQKERHKIPDGETGEIISDWCNGVYTQQELGEIYGISQSAISKIVNGKRRSNIIYD